jgi:hypothetical protein
MLVGWADIWMGRRWVGPGIVGVGGRVMLLGAAAVHMHIGGRGHVGFGESSPVRRRIVVVGVQSGVQHLEAASRRSWPCMLVGCGERIAAGLVGVFVLRVLCGRKGLGGC